MASLTQWTWDWASSGRWWRTGKPDVLQSIGLQRVGQNWTTERQKIDNSKDYLLPPLSGARVRNPTRDKVMRKEAWQNARTCSASGIPPGNSWASTLKTRLCLLYCVMLSTYSSDINRGLSPHHLFLEKVNLELLDNKSPGHNKGVSIQKPLWWLSSLPAGLVQLRMRLFEASWPHRKLKTS